MYIFFNNHGHEIMRYYTDTIPESLMAETYRKVDTVPYKEGYDTKAKLVSGEISWVYEKQERTLVEELQEENKKLAKSSQMSLATILQLDKKVLELEKKIDELSK